MDPVSILLPNIDSKIAEKQFEKEQQIQRKIQMLRTGVFKNMTFKKSLSVRHPRIRSKGSSIKDQEKQVINTEQRQPQSKASITSIQFGNSKNRSQSVRSINIGSPRHKILFQAKKSSNKEADQLLRKISIQKLLLQKPIEQKKTLKEMRNSQTILKKSSLFLMNCLKTRYKERLEVPSDDLGYKSSNIQLGNFSDKKKNNLKYEERFQYMLEVKRRMSRKDQQSKVKGMYRTNSLVPEPW